jgi:heptosyltransferase-1
MSEILFIKTSSLGDVIHHMPAVTEARQRCPQARFSWVVEEAFAPLVRLHPAVDNVIPVATRRWRRAALAPALWGSTAGEVGAFIGGLRTRRYDEVIDSQGLLLKSGLVAALAHGRSHGFDRHSIREPLASLVYDVRHEVARDLHAVTRNRQLTGQALGYAPSGPIDYGLDRRKLGDGGAQSYGILLHATARAEKEWPEADWMALGRRLAGQGDVLVLPWGTETEHARSQRIAAGVPNARVPERQPLDHMARLIAGASFVVGVDTGLLHLAAALGVPLTAIFVGSAPGLTGPLGAGRIVTVGDRARAPSVEVVWDALKRTR